MAHRLTQVGRSATRLDGQAKVSGAMRYAADIQRPGMIWGKCLRSPYAHARIATIDCDQIGAPVAPAKFSACAGMKSDGRTLYWL